MLASKLRIGDTIGIVSPSHVASVDDYAKIISEIEAKGFQVKAGENLYKNTYGYLATETERADDFNNMVSNETVKMVFFGGGFGSVELLPLIDYENIKKNPKLFLSYSDGTSILSAIYSRTGLITYYGQTPGEFVDLRWYDYEQFSSHFLQGRVHDFISNSNWHSLNNGTSDGILVGGYTWNFALLLNTDFFSFNNEQKYILFLEDHERFNNVAGISMLISYIEQNKFINNVAGLLFGHYSDKIFPDLMGRLARFGKKYNVPVAYCDDFGHGKNHAILPIGCNAVLDTKCKSMRFSYPDE